jgi:DNA-binding IclR family transcriptional regulator
MRVPKSTLTRLLHSMEAHGHVLHMPAERCIVPAPRSPTLALPPAR